MAGDLRHVQPHELPVWWSLVRDRVASTCERSSGKYQPADILKQLVDGQMQLWAVLDEEPEASEDETKRLQGSRARQATEGPQIKAIAITEISQFPRARVCWVLACTGDVVDDWLDHLSEIESWAHARGCTAIEPVARPGWERRLNSRGYRKTHVVLEKTLIAEKAT